MHARTSLILALLCVHSLGVWTLATVVRAFDAAHISVAVGNFITFGFPAICALFAFLLVLSESERRARRVERFLVLPVCAAVLTFISTIVSQFALWVADERFGSRWVERTSARLADDPRFSKVYVMALSRDYFLFPYHPVGGTVTSEQDRIVLNRVLNAEWSPGQRSAVVVQVEGAPGGLAVIEEYIRRLNEDE